MRTTNRIQAPINLASYTCGCCKTEQDDTEKLKLRTQAQGNEFQRNKSSSWAQFLLPNTASQRIEKFIKLLEHLSSITDHEQDWYLSACKPSQVHCTLSIYSCFHSIILQIHTSSAISAQCKIMKEERWWNDNFYINKRLFNHIITNFESFIFGHKVESTSLILPRTE